MVYEPDLELDMETWTGYRKFTWFAAGHGI